MSTVAARYASEASLVSSGYPSEHEIAIARRVNEIEAAAGPDALVQTVIDKQYGVVTAVRVHITLQAQKANGK